MKVMVWIADTNLELLSQGEIIQYWLREPGDALNVVQVQLSYDEYIRLRDGQPDHYSTKNHMRFINYAGTHDGHIDFEFDGFDHDDGLMGIED